MKSKLMLAGVIAAAALAAGVAHADGVVTIYSADGLHDGTPSWFGDQFDAFTKATGIKVQYVEAGSGVVVERVAKEESNTAGRRAGDAAALHPEGGGRRSARALHAGRRRPDRRGARRTRTATTSRSSTTT